GFNTPMIIPTGIAQFYQIRDCGSSRNVAFPPLAKAEGLPSSRKLYVSIRFETLESEYDPSLWFVKFLTQSIL
ncbi:hypothetical protein ACE1AT_26100, partial [Pelatocladus sp. BLCC-F211]|uniref:hypothetical protein n=1 Tax=Pelatocladus sp. BLCC-F211 TaxID=3342752 RepID=UPI0035BABD6E